MVGGQPGQTVQKTLPRRYQIQKKSDGVVQVVEA
jgi:hypothetical protein